MGRVTVRRPAVHYSSGVASPRFETLASEEPLEIRVAGRSLAVTMRTPGDDFDLAIGFLVTEGFLARGSEVSAIRYCAGATDEGINTYNVLDVAFAPGVPLPDPSLERSFFTTSSCGLCGKASIDAVRTRSSHSVSEDVAHVSAETLSSMPHTLRAAQKVFDKTGGLHAAGLFTAAGELLCLREDVGRHNAVDKVIGWAAREGRLPLSGCVLMVSGRASFELTQKAFMAGIPVLAAVSAPSSLAVELAEEVGITLIGFLRGEDMTVYAGAERIAALTGAASAAPAVDLEPEPGEPVSFRTHILPLFRASDRASMKGAFDLWEHADVAANAAAIGDRLRVGSMPCDGAWPPECVALFERWVAAGCPE